MIKREELSNPQSCLNRAKDDEMLFVLLGHDIASPAAIRAWINERLRLGRNTLKDRQISDAIFCSGVMQLESQGLPEYLASSTVAIAMCDICGEAMDALAGVCRFRVKDGTKLLLGAHCEKCNQKFRAIDSEQQSHDAELRRIATELGLPWPTTVEDIVKFIRAVVPAHRVSWEIEAFCIEYCLSIRAMNGILNAGCHTISDLTEKTEAEMLGVKNIGRVTVSEIRHALSRKGLSFRSATA